VDAVRDERVYTVACCLGLVHRYGKAASCEIRATIGSLIPPDVSARRASCRPLICSTCAVDDDRTMSQSRSKGHFIGTTSRDVIPLVPVTSRTSSMTSRSHTAQPFDAQCCQMGTAIQHPVPDRVKPSFVIFDIRTL